MMGIVLRYVLPAILFTGFGWFGVNKIVHTIQRAEQATVLEQRVDELVLTYNETVEAHAEDLKLVEAAALETEQRREHWRQSYYKVKKEYDDYTKEWGPNRYPDELN